MDYKEQLSQKIYDTALQEYSAFLEETKSRGMDQVVDRAYQIVMMSDLLMLFENVDFSVPELETFSALEKPLELLYGEWLRSDDSHMESLRGAVTSFASDRLHDKATLLYSDPSIPRYDKSYATAQSLDETHLYRASRKRDLDCRRFFGAGISMANESRTMRAFVEKWTEDYGHDRCKFVLGCTIARADWDGRYSSAAKSDAQRQDYGDHKDGFDPFGEYHTSAHPCLVNGAYELLLKQARGKEAKQKNQPER